MTWFCQHSTEAGEVLESDVPGNSAMLAQEVGTCLSVNESISLLNTVVSRNNKLVATS